MTTLPCHPRVALLRGYPGPSKPSLPQEYVQVTPKICRSSTKLAASADLDQLAAWVSSNPAKKSVRPAPQGGERNNRIPFRNVQNLNQLDEDVPLAAVKVKTTPRPLPRPPTDIITGETTSRMSNGLPTPPSTPSYTSSTRFIQNIPAPIRSPPPPPSHARAKFPSGFIDEVSGYTKMTDYVQRDNNQIGHGANGDDSPRPASRRGLFRSQVESFHDLYYGDIDHSVFKRTGGGKGNDRADGEASMEECDISEVSPLEFDVEEEEMTRELIKMLDF